MSLFPKRFQSRRRIVGAVKAYLIAVEFIERLINVTERVFFDGQGLGEPTIGSHPLGLSHLLFGGNGTGGRQFARVLPRQ